MPAHLREKGSGLTEKLELHGPMIDRLPNRGSVDFSFSCQNDGKMFAARRTLSRYRLGNRGSKNLTEILFSNFRTRRTSMIKIFWILLRRIDRVERYKIF